MQALINPAGPGGKCVTLAREGKAALFVTSFILDEIRESHLKIPAKYGVTQQQTEALAAAIASVATLVIDVPEVFTYRRDPDDAHYVDVALAINAKLIISRDRDLLDLMDETSADGTDFKRKFPDLQVLDPVQFLALIRASTP